MFGLQDFPFPVSGRVLASFNADGIHGGVLDGLPVVGIMQQFYFHVTVLLSDFKNLNFRFGFD